MVGLNQKRLRKQVELGNESVLWVMWFLGQRLLKDIAKYYFIKNILIKAFSHMIKRYITPKATGVSTNPHRIYEWTLNANKKTQEK